MSATGWIVWRRRPDREDTVILVADTPEVATAELEKLVALELADSQSYLREALGAYFITTCPRAA